MTFDNGAPLRYVVEVQGLRCAEWSTPDAHNVSPEGRGLADRRGRRVLMTVPGGMHDGGAVASLANAVGLLVPPSERRVKSVILFHGNSRLTEAWTPATYTHTVGIVALVSDSGARAVSARMELRVESALSGSGTCLNSPNAFERPILMLGRDTTLADLTRILDMNVCRLVGKAARYGRVTVGGRDICDDLSLSRAILCGPYRADCHVIVWLTKETSSLLAALDIEVVEVDGDPHGRSQLSSTRLVLRGTKISTLADPIANVYSDFQLVRVELDDAEKGLSDVFDVAPGRARSHLVLIFARAGTAVRRTLPPETRGVMELSGVAEHWVLPSAMDLDAMARKHWAVGNTSIPGHTLYGAKFDHKNKYTTRTVIRRVALLAKACEGGDRWAKSYVELLQKEEGILKGNCSRAAMCRIDDVLREGCGTLSPLEVSVDGTFAIVGGREGAVVHVVDWDGRMGLRSLFAQEGTTVQMLLTARSVEAVGERMRTPAIESAYTRWLKTTDAVALCNISKLTGGTKDVCVFEAMSWREVDTAPATDNVMLCFLRVREGLVLTTDAVTNRVIFRETEGKTADSFADIVISVPRATAHELFELKEDGVSILRARNRHGQDDGVLSWMFTVSHNRSDTAYLHLASAMGVGTRYTHVLVVQKSQFDAYRERWGETHAILVLPESLERYITENGKMLLKLSANAKRGGCGYARLVVQLVAHRLGLEAVHVWDDNIRACEQLRPMKAGDQTSGTLTACRFDVVLKHLEGILNVGGGVVTDTLNFEVRTEPQEADVQRTQRAAARACERLEDLCSVSESDRRPTSWETFSPGASEIGLIGFQAKGKFGGKSVKRPFSVSHSITKAVLINVRATVSRGVLYPIMTEREDFEFAHMCVEAGLRVVKCNRFFLRKNYALAASTSKSVCGQLECVGFHSDVPIPDTGTAVDEGLFGESQMAFLGWAAANAPMLLFYPPSATAQSELQMGCGSSLVDIYGELLLSAADCKPGVCVLWHASRMHREGKVTTLDAKEIVEWCGDRLILPNADMHTRVSVLFRTADCPVVDAPARTFSGVRLLNKLGVKERCHCGKRNNVHFSTLLSTLVVSPETVSSGFLLLQMTVSSRSVK